MTAAATNPGTRGLALALAFLLPALLIAGLLAVVVWRLRGGRMERRRPALLSGLCAFCVIASALTRWLRLT